MIRQKGAVGILSLGCPRNLVDSEHLLGRLKRKGYRIVDMDKADIAIVNTCAFIEDAKRESIDALLDVIELKKEKKLKKIIVYGCLSQRYKHALREHLPEIDAFVGKVSLNHSTDHYALTPAHFAYLKICEGCLNACSYCIIPSIKGRFESVPADSLINKVGQFDSAGTKELNIVGQDISGYGTDIYKAPRLKQLIKDIAKRLHSIGWLRLLYLYPSRVDEGLLAIIRNEPRICKYIDLPLQHINDGILKLMNRRMNGRDIRILIDKIRKKVPGAALRTSLIVGFPSESDENFKELVQFVKEVRFERLGVFMYSREEGTASYGFSGQIPQRVKLERFNELMSLQQQIASGINKEFRGKVVDVLIDEKDAGLYLGRTQYDAPEVDGTVFVHSPRQLSPGDFVKVEITDTLEYDLVGKALP